MISAERWLTAERLARAGQWRRGGASPSPLAERTRLIPADPCLAGGAGQGAWSQTLGEMEVFALVKRYRIPCAPVRDVGEVMHDPHMHERRMLEWIDHDQIGRIVIPTSPLRFHDADSFGRGTSRKPVADPYRISTDPLDTDWSALIKSRIGPVSPGLDGGVRRTQDAHAAPAVEDE
jgi:hypothetical protein